MNFIYGKEKYLIRERVLEIEHEFLEKYPTASINIFDWAESFEPALFSESLANSGLFAQEKLIVVKNSLKLNQENQVKFLDLLKDFKKKNNKRVMLVLAEFEDGACRGKLFNFLKRASQVTKFDLLKGSELNQWIERLAEKRSQGKVGVEVAAANWLGIITHGNLWKISQEIEKLINFKESGMATLKDVKAICQGQVEGKIFDLVDAVGRGDKSRALRLKSQLLNQGENEFYIFSMIIFQARNLLKVSECARKGISDKRAVSQKTGLHPFVAQKTLSQLRNFSSNKIAEIYKLAAEIDLKSKQSDFQMARELDYFLVKF
ncbi:MAG TPA: DNA polymerase III subunit delta [Candidatus Moranbacteria bacterium]|nr:DNA polymerase III subunit delta [Candidatus Moranbacteria bacterium]